MPNKKEGLMVQAVFAFAQGCGDAQIDEDAGEWFYQEYYPWIDKKKKDGESPQDVWAVQGKSFLGKFKEIGRRAAQGGAVKKQALIDASRAVQQESECPFCPDKP
ncbi:MAG: hypothetical protein QOF89_4969 [Acidobacteriota bacterium]|jgi:hypothetical protein|nr:hypothetical protein [Acidobacteriota bacterium]